MIQKIYQIHEPVLTRLIKENEKIQIEKQDFKNKYYDLREH